jgi:hypothetical protein
MAIAAAGFWAGAPAAGGGLALGEAAAAPVAGDPDGGAAAGAPAGGPVAAPAAALVATAGALVAWDGTTTALAAGGACVGGADEPDAHAAPTRTRSPLKRIEDARMC